MSLAAAHILYYSYSYFFYFFFFNDPPTTEIYTLSLHDALPISLLGAALAPPHARKSVSVGDGGRRRGQTDRKSTRLNSSHPSISYAVFCLKKKKKNPLDHLMLILTRCKIFISKLPHADRDAGHT